MIGAMIRRVLGRPESRSSYADLVLNQVEAAATSGGVIAAADGGVQQAAGAISRMLSLATVDAPADLILTPHTLAAIAFDLVRSGESLWLLDVSKTGRIELLRASVATVFGGPRRENWIYSLNISGPTVTSNVKALASEVLHVRVNAGPERPWQGVSPLGQASATGRLARALTSSLGDEAATAVATVIAVASGTSQASSNFIENAISTIGSRRLAFPETQFGTPVARTSAPQTDWIPRHIRPEPDENAVKLYGAIQMQIAAVCGLPAVLANPAAAGPAQREGFRQLLVGTVKPLARLLEEEISRVLERPIKLRHHEAAAVDAAARARAARGLVESQVVTADQALVLVGWD